MSPHSGRSTSTTSAITSPRSRAPRLDWVIVGGESGPGARPFNLAWARSTIEQCRECGADALRLRDRKGGDMAEWPEDLRVREWPEVRR